MSFWESLAMTGTMATVLGVALTVYGILNNRTLRAEMGAVRDLIREFRQGTVEFQQRALELQQRALEILDRVERGQEALRQEVAEVRREVAEARREMAEARREMAEALKYLANLIVSESERTRQAIRGTP